VLIGTLSANCLNLYSGALAALVAWDVRRRINSALGVGAILAALTAAVLIAARANDPGARFSPATVAVAALVVGALGFTVVRWTLARWQSAVAVGVLGGALAFGNADPASTAHLYTNFLGLLTMWAAPWAGVMLAMRGETTRRVDAHALTAWVAGIAASLPFWQQSWLTGSLAAAYPWLGDVSYFVGFAVAYAVASLSARAASQPASRREASGGTSQSAP
jgi:purine-cytosine permease-like protein